MENHVFENHMRKTSHDKHRPAFHFLPEKNWMNDPNGLIQWKGQYHLFYQYNPNGPFHGTIHWGHAVSKDLIYWQDLPIALTPAPGEPDEEGCWSGCCVNQDGAPVIVYTGVHPQVVCLATGSDDLVNWQKYPGNPVIPAPPEELGGRTEGQFRDPFLWNENGSWYMVIGSKIEGQGGIVLRYRSDDLRHWEYLGILMQGDINQPKPFWTGSIWECPNFFKLNEKYVLFFSVQSEPSNLLYPVYYTGDYDGKQFIPTCQDILVHGNSFYAPQAMHSEDGRVLMLGWLQEGRRPNAHLDTGWAGVMSLPLALSLVPDGKLQIEPVEELKSLRREHSHYENVVLTQGFPGLPGDLRGECLEIEAVLEPGPLAEFGLKLLVSPDGQEQTSIVYNCSQERLIIELSKSSLSTLVDRDMHKAPLSLEADGSLRLHIFLDRSVIEVFANRHPCLAARVYPTRPDSLGLDLFARSGETKLKSLDIWKMGSIWD
jgi:beta-fructofuranosidase